MSSESRNSNKNRICNHNSQKIVTNYFFLNFVKTQHCPVSSRLILNDHLDVGQGVNTMENLTNWSLLLLSFVIKSWLLQFFQFYVTERVMSARNFDATFWRVLPVFILPAVSWSMFIYFILKFCQNRRHLLAKNVKFDMSESKALGILVWATYFGPNNTSI